MNQDANCHEHNLLNILIEGKLFNDWKWILFTQGKKYIALNFLKKA